MRKSTKILLITALSFFLVGLVLTVGGAVGGGFQAVSRYVSFPRWHGNFHVMDREESDLTMLIEENRSFDSLHLDIEMGGLEIRPSEDDQLRIYGEEFRTQDVSWNVDDGVLELEGSLGGGWIILEIPDEKYYNLHAELDGATLCADALNVENVCEIDVDGGSLEMDVLEAKQVSLSCTGRVSVETITADSVLFDCDAGSYTVGCINANCLEADVDAGSVTVSSADIRSGGRVDLDVDAGNVDLSMSGNREDYGISGDYSLSNVLIDGHKHHSSHHENCSRSMQINCDMGNVNVRFEGTGAGGTGSGAT